MHVKIIAHRGAPTEAPENTLGSFKLAWKTGADGIEGDFRLTRDGRLVCIHDDTTARVGDRDLPVSKSTLEELRTVDAGVWKDEQWRGERIPTAEEVIATAPPQGWIYFEIKGGAECIEPLRLAMEQTGFDPGRAVVMSFDAGAVAEAARLIPGATKFWITALTDNPRTGAIEPSVIKIINTVRRAGADGLNVGSHPSIDARFVEDLQDAGLACHVWTVDNPDKAAEYIGMGMGAITTNRVGWLRDQLALAGSWTFS